MVISRAGRVVAVGGGHGVGKSVVAANLAVALAQDGARVVLVDAAAGAISQHALFGIARPGPGVEAFLAGALPDLAAGAVETGVAGLRLVPGSGAVVGAGELPTARTQQLIGHLRALDADVVLVDLGAAVGFDALDLFDAADLRLLVVTPALTSAHHAYAFMAGAAFRKLRRVAAAGGQLTRLDDALAGADATSGTGRLLAQLSGQDPALAASLRTGLSGFAVRLVGNKLSAARETGLIYALSRMAQEFLGIEASVLGSLRNSQGLHDSAGAGRPYLLHAAAEGAEGAATFRTIARALRAARWPASSAAGAEHAAPPPARAAALPVALPVNLADYERGYERHLVDLPATLVHPGGRLQVQLKDVSEGGALFEADQLPPVGTRGTLAVAGLADQPALACVVRHCQPASRRAGVQFLAGRDEGRRVVDGIRMLGLDRLLGDEAGAGRGG